MLKKFKMFRENKKIVENEDSKQVAEDLSLAFDEIQKHIEKHSDNQIIDGLEISDNYETSCRIIELKKENVVLKRKLTVLQKKYDAIKAEQDKLDDGFKNYMKFTENKNNDMTEQQAEKAIELLDELKELKKIDKLLIDKNRHNINVRFHQHHGDCHDYDYEQVRVDKRHLPKFLEVLRKVIDEVENEFEKL